MLFLFVQHWYRMGWKVIVYDRFGQHREFIEDMLDWSGFDYHPYTSYQLVNPEKYNLDFAAKKGCDFKTFYKMEKNWYVSTSMNIAPPCIFSFFFHFFFHFFFFFFFFSVFSLFFSFRFFVFCCFLVFDSHCFLFVFMLRGYKGVLVDDIGDQDGDKTKTYDFARVEYSYLHSIIFVDSDEFLYCPQANRSLASQIRYQRKLMDHFSSQGYDSLLRLLPLSFQFCISIHKTVLIPSVLFNRFMKEFKKWDLCAHPLVHLHHQILCIRQHHAQRQILQIQRISVCRCEKIQIDQLLIWLTDLLLLESVISHPLHILFYWRIIPLIQRGYADKDVPAMFACWSDASSFDNFQKSADFAGVCPFHYNHWSCDGGRNGGRDSGKWAPRCRCKVAFDMTDTAFIPRLDRCKE